MGEYLSKPDRNKEVETGSNEKVSKFDTNFFPSFNMPLSVCKDGDALWRILISLTLIWATETHSLESLMDTEVRKNISF